VNLRGDSSERGLEVIVITQQIELRVPVGRMIAAVMLGLADIELQSLSARQVASIAVHGESGTGAV